MKKYYVTAGNNGTELGVLTESNSKAVCRSAGRRAVNEALPNGEGSYVVHDSDTGEPIEVAEKSIRTGFCWMIR
ncbi:MAG: hypothetical protein WC332_00415 [Clostridia bacterium]|jgi:hypothetical protein